MTTHEDSHLLIGSDADENVAEAGCAAWEPVLTALFDGEAADAAWYAH